METYLIKTSEKLGKHLIANKNFETDEEILSESPLVFGPKPHSIDSGPFPCVGCCKPLTEDKFKCPECIWPICSQECKGLTDPYKHASECKILKLRIPVEIKPFFEHYRFDILIIIRALFLQVLDETKWKKLLELQDHLEQRGEDTVIYKSVEEKATYLLSTYFVLLQQYEKEFETSVLPTPETILIHRIYAILDVNATELTENLEAMVLYYTPSLVEHNCVPNSYQIIDPETTIMTLKASLEIKKDSHITNSYTNILWGTYSRRQHLKANKYFDCDCDRCKDPTEMNTFFSALSCLGTGEDVCGGIQLPQEPLNNETNWICDKCKIELPNEDVMKFVNHLNNEVEKMLDKKPTLEELEDISQKLLTFLHPNHYLIFSIKHCLVQLMTVGDIEPNQVLLQEKQNMCEKLLWILQQLDPGFARLSLYGSVLLDEIFNVKFKVLMRSFEENSNEENFKLIKDIFANLETNKKILQKELLMKSGQKLHELVLEREKSFKEWLQTNKFN